MSKRLSPSACFAALAASALVLAVWTGPSGAQSLPPSGQAGCYNVIPAQPGAQPAILLDRCSGRSWQLVAQHRGMRRRMHLVYVWSPIDRSEREVAHVEPPRRTSPAPAAPSLPAAGSSKAKCFVFNGRTFCE